MGQVGAELQPTSQAYIFLEEVEPFSYHKRALPKRLHGPLSKSNKGLGWASAGPVLRNPSG